MCLKVEVGTVSNTPKLAPTEGEEVLDIGGSVGVVGKLFRIMVAEL